MTTWHLSRAAIGGYLTVQITSAVRTGDHGVFQRLIAEVNLQGHRIVELRCDCAPEIVSSQMQAIFDEHGIVFNRSPPYTPQSNGKAERPIDVWQICVNKAY